MPDIREVAESVYRLEIPIAGDHVPTVAYFIRDGGGALIEPGPAAAVPALKLAMARLGARELSWIIPTHIHVDHAGGAGMLATIFPEARVVVHPRGARHLADPAYLIRLTRRVHGDDFEVRSGAVLPVPDNQLEVARNGQRITLGGTVLKIIYAPGHAPHHLVILHAGLNGLFCGEALGVPPHLIPSAAPYSFNHDDYLATIADLGRLSPSVLFFSHGGADEHPEKAFASAAEYAMLYAEMVLEAITRGDSPPDIARRFVNDVKRRFGLLYDFDIATVFVAGYSTYLDRKRPNQRRA